MRDRLIELCDNLILSCKSSLCEDCEHNNIDYPNCMGVHFADYLLANGVIVPPCKVGDTVYYETYTNNGSTSIGVQPHKIIAHRLRMVTESNCLIADFEIGKTVFLTREEAERALKGGGEGCD